MEKDTKGLRVSCDACWQEVDGRDRSIGEGSSLIVQLTVIRWRSVCAREMMMKKSKSDTQTRLTAELTSAMPGLVYISVDK